jgi:hypothetical protein
MISLVLSPLLINEKKWENFDARSREFIDLDKTLDGLQIELNTEISSWDPRDNGNPLAIATTNSSLEYSKIRFSNLIES